MERTYTVYMHFNKINSKVYIGITILKPTVRWGKDGCNYKESPYFWSAIQKYGWENFDHLILATGLSKEEAAEQERFWISEFNSQDKEHGYNLASGGYSQPGEENPFWGHTHSEETRRAVAESNKRRVWTQEARQKCRDKLIGSNNDRAKVVKCIETGIEYPSLRDASEAVHVSRSRISEAANGHRKTCAGYHWQYV